MSEETIQAQIEKGSIPPGSAGTIMIQRERSEPTPKASERSDAFRYLLSWYQGQSPPLAPIVSAIITNL